MKYNGIVVEEEVCGQKYVCRIVILTNIVTVIPSHVRDNFYSTNPYIPGSRFRKVSAGKKNDPGISKKQGG
jgi:hypothetical protein